MRRSTIGFLVMLTLSMLALPLATQRSRRGKCTGSAVSQAALLRRAATVGTRSAGPCASWAG
jgi:hypothetical protein